MFRPLLTPASLALAALAQFSGPSTAWSEPIRDCRVSGEIAIPMVPRGFDLVTHHAFDDLAGPSIFERVVRTRDGEALDLVPRPYPDYASQVEAYLTCDVPFMRVTHAMMSDIAARTEIDPRTKMIPVYFYGWSNGADVLVARGVTTLSDLAGKVLVTDAPRLDFAMQMAEEVSPPPQIRVVDDPSAVFSGDPSIDFATVTSAQAERLTAGAVGTGAEGSVKGARTILTTTTASRVNGDLVVVRADYMSQAPDRVEAVVRGLLKAEELFREDAKKQVVDFELAAGDMLGHEDMAPIAKAMWAGVETVGLKGQIDWADATAPRGYRALVNESQSRMVKYGLLDAAKSLNAPDLDFASLGDDLWDKRRVETSSFDADAADQALKAMSNEDRAQNTIATVTITFEPNQASFPFEKYRAAFETALKKSRTYAGAILSIEAHSAYNGYVRGVVKDHWTPARQKREIAHLTATSTARALAVRDALMRTAREMGFTIDESQFIYDGRGISDPLGGFCREGLPCPPKTEEEWKASRRVVFRVIGMEAEDDVFIPLNEW